MPMFVGCLYCSHHPCMLALYVACNFTQLTVCIKNRDGFRDENMNYIQLLPQTQAYVFFILFDTNKGNVFTGHTNL